MERLERLEMGLDVQRRDPGAQLVGRLRIVQGRGLDREHPIGTSPAERPLGLAAADRAGDRTGVALGRHVDELRATDVARAVGAPGAVQKVHVHDCRFALRRGSVKGMQHFDTYL